MLHLDKTAYRSSAPARRRPQQRMHHMPLLVAAAGEMQPTPQKKTDQALRRGPSFRVMRLLLGGFCGLLRLARGFAFRSRRFLVGFEFGFVRFELGLVRLYRIFIVGGFVGLDLDRKSTR